MKKASIIKNGQILTENAEVANSFFSRFRGLMFKKAIDADYALCITPCNQIHMLNMRFAIDAVYLSGSGTVVKIDENVKPNKICKTVKNAKSVIEMNSGAAAKFGIREGDRLEVRDL